ncbi:uncharacterized protein F5Z01DRAFT_355249 [Emericellopsis atlantica]|uniref:Uncharacterized protein n=1 Tax=Emericellopsis atlantica TaxID=2614577 RepID=A0A9P7ZET1_9HYPO|nr:uncharacterized protein F5Z01DRAFT_355249 [Emericellopsis atlantica]KAG9250660.1 hypothetical protein F5Z01DRAFT_355249 [Emericellopsis atlantica]
MLTDADTDKAMSRRTRNGPRTWTRGWRSKGSRLCRIGGVLRPLPLVNPRSVEQKTSTGTVILVSRDEKSQSVPFHEGWRLHQTGRPPRPLPWTLRRNTKQKTARKKMLKATKKAIRRGAMYWTPSQHAAERLRHCPGKYSTCLWNLVRRRVAKKKVWALVEAASEPEEWTEKHEDLERLRKRDVRICPQQPFLPLWRLVRQRTEAL